MFHLRFNHVFFGLMGLSFLSAFIISPRVTDRPRAHIQNIFAPVAKPVNLIGGWVHSKISPPEIRDDGSPKAPRQGLEVFNENLRLRIQVANLTSVVAQLQEREADRAKLGDVRSVCTPFNVIGGDSAPRDSLMIGATSMDGVKENMPVLYTGGIAGRISRAGVGGSQVLLVTDPGSKLTATFARFVKKPDGTPDFQRLATDAVLIQGAGNGSMVSRITEKLAKDIGVRLEDWVVLSDHDWPAILDGYRLGRVISVLPSKSPGFVEIRIVPDSNLTMVREVMVMNKGKG
jgi:cell shape-determining protein MreC